MAKDPLKKQKTALIIFEPTSVSSCKPENRFKNTAADSQQKKKPVPSIPN